MRATRRSFLRETDLPAMLELAAASPGENLHVVDLPYRLCSWALDDPSNVAVWADTRGRVAAWAVLQAPFWTIDVAIRPEAEDDLFPRVLDWVDARARSAKGTPHERPSWYFDVFADHAGRLRCLEAAGYACQADVGEDSWSRVLLRRDDPAPSSPRLSAGFAVRPLAGRTELEEYVELHRATFESKSMTVDWRARTLAAPHYLSDSDLVAVAPDGRLAGFCIGWLLPQSDPVGQIEPLGIGREFREHGLGAALLAECVRRLAARGARTVLVETDTYRTPALGLYEGAGFTPIRDVLVYRKDAPNL